MQPIDSYYYSPFHVARDFVGNVAPFTFFVGLASLCFPDFACALSALLRAAFGSQSWVVGLFFIGVYIALALMCGMLAERLAILARDLWRESLASRGRPDIDYWGVYRGSQNAIDALYMKYITATPATLSIYAPVPQAEAGRPSLVEKVDRLCAFFKIHNPVGFRHLYWDYVRVFMFRQCWTYLFLFAVIAALSRNFSLAAAFVTVCFLAVVPTGRVVRDAVDAEYQFLLATASWLEQQPSSPRPEPVTGKATSV